jgi:UDPglucose 6-dehydrogenase
MSVSRVGVVGAGYVGLTTAACLAHLGHVVTCGDVDEARVGALRLGQVPILEDGLPALVQEGLTAGRLRFVVGGATAAAGQDFVFLCVPTPQSDDGAADMSFVEQAAREIAPVLAPGTVVVNKSTMPVGSTRLVERILQENGAAAHEVHVASNPEFLREGTAVRDFLHPDRVVIGCDDTATAVRVSDLYRSLAAAILVTDPASAEMVKYASNAFLATKIAFINNVANLCESVGADVREVALGMGYDKRIGFEFLKPGPGYGGSCFPKDTAALLHIARLNDVGFPLLAGVIGGNDAQYERMIDKVRAAVGGDLSSSTIGAWGLTFKANTDDLRQSPAIHVVRRLLEEGAKVRAYDPAADRAAVQTLAPGVEQAAGVYETCAGADAVVVLTEWDEFRWVDFGRVAELVASRTVVDCRNLLDPAVMRRRGFTYLGVGR